MQKTVLRLIGLMLPLGCPHGSLHAQSPSIRGDIDLDGEVNITDPIHNLSYQFLGGTLPLAPFPEAGPDPTTDDPLPCRG